MTRRAGIVVAVSAIVLLVAVILVRRSDEADSAGGAGAATERFFDTYVTADGQVIRHDQGGDTVSEGQAYAMRLAVDDGDRPRFDAVWTWTKTHLQRSDGLFAWRWQDGAIVDEDPAADADFDIADALRVAGEAFGDPAYAAEAKRIGKAVLDSETVDSDVGSGDEIVLVAGTWAVHDRIVNPSYAAPCEYEQFASLTGDHRWSDLSNGSFELLRDLIASALPPDWVVLDDDGTPTPIAAPDDRNGAGRYGLDAYRVPARLITCPTGRELAAQLAPRIERLDDDGTALAYSLDGKIVENGAHPLGLIAGALTASAVGDYDRAASLMDRATKLERDHSTYYGSAWVALADDLIAGRTETTATTSAAGASDHSSARHGALAHGTGRRFDLTPLQLATPTSQAAATTTTSVAESVTTTTDPPDTSSATTVAAPTTTRPASATTTTAAPTQSTSPAPTTTAAGGAIPTTSPTTDAAPTASDGTVPDSAATASTDATDSTDATGATDATDATDASTPTSDSTDSAAGGDSSGDDATTPSDRVDPARRHSSVAVDLTPSPSDIDQFIPGATPAVHGETRLEAQRQHTGAIALAGLIAATILGAGFGLRERAIVRRAQQA